MSTIQAKPKPAPRVLVVDDDPVFVKTISEVAKQQRIPITSFSSPMEAYRATQAIKFDVAILDYDLGKVTGVQLARHLLRTAQSPVLIVSNCTDLGNNQWPHSIKKFLPKSLGAQALLVEALMVYDAACDESHPEPGGTYV